MSYQQLEETAEVDAMIAGSEPAWLFKHSQTCGISHAAKEQVDAYLAGQDDTIGIVIVQTHRPVSNHIAQALERVHQSPQIFLLQGGEVKWTATHYSITSAAMAEARKQLA
ncbi:MAG: bacillithiol system redox-active protein YtxJ [Planctomycetota bacterium]|jgi:bacillithiol system protein YtxJ|nr:bacillithiol system redox-active protein YtxJ [Planctomycetota bacterium]